MSIFPCLVVQIPLPVGDQLVPEVSVVEDKVKKPVGIWYSDLMLLCSTPLTLSADFTRRNQETAQCCQGESSGSNFTA